MFTTAYSRSSGLIPYKLYKLSLSISFMKVLLTYARSSVLKGGTEVFGEGLKKMFPDLEILDFVTVSRKHGLPQEPFALFKEPLCAKHLDRWFMRNFGDYEPEVVFTNGMYGWALDSKVPVINIQHGGFASLAKSAIKKTSLNHWRTRLIYGHYEKRGCRKGDAVVSNSQFTRDNVLREYGCESRVIHNPIDTEIFRPRSGVRKELGLPEDRKIAIFVGGPEYSKGFDIVEKLARRFRDVLFLIVSNAGVGLEGENVEVHLNVDQPELSRLYSAADFCLYTSRFEGFGYVPLEALACNTPVIGNRTGVFGSLDCPGVHFARELKDYVREIEGLEPGSAKSREVIKKGFGFEGVKKSYRKVVEEVL